VIQDLDPAVISSRLERVRERTLSLVSGLDWQILRTQHIPILSPMVWDLGHIANFEELWLCQYLARLEPLEAEFAGMFDAVLNPRPTRQDLPLPAARSLWDYMSKVRSRAIGVLGEANDKADSRILDRGFVYEMVAEHEEQHQETVLQLLQILESPSFLPALRRSSPPGRTLPESMVLIPGGSFRMGSAGQTFAYDNELPQHERTLPPYWIDAAPVSCGEYLGFIQDDGYEREELWSAVGWDWRSQTDAIAPANWSRQGDGWQVRHMNRVEPLPANLPVVHVSYFEAEAFAMWAGKRLPTEAEWEKAALWDPAADRARLYPWGDTPPDPQKANLDQLTFQPAPVGAYPQGASAYGVEQLIGDVWEWTCSDFEAYPGFASFPYDEYSKIFFGPEYKVLRGGSWATRPAVARGTIRNWDHPIRRQIFSGFRCVRDID